MKNAAQIKDDVLERTRELLQSQDAFLGSRQIQALAQAVAEELAEMYVHIGALGARQDT